MTSAMSLTIDQLLLAAQLLEQQQKISMIDSVSMCKLGQDYEKRIMQTKMRGVDISTTTALGLANSTGSSLRSSPYCSQNSSSPNSPYDGQILPSNMRGNAKLSSSSVAPLLTGRSSNSTVSLSAGSVSQSTRQSRLAHNQLEKTRRANLRSYLDKLKSVLPTDPDSSRDTTLSLLTRARNYIRLIKQQKQALLIAKQEELAESARLMARLDALNQQAPIVEESLQLVRPEPQHLDQQSPLYMEFSPSAKPSNASLDSLHPALNALLNLNALQMALNQVTTTSATAALLSSVLAANQQINLNPPILPIRNIDLINNGLIPKLPLLYPYNNSC